MNINEAKNIYFIGIGGIGTSGIAKILQKKAKKISGSDICRSSITKSLKLSKVQVNIGHRPEQIVKDIDLVVYSPAIPSDNPELTMAKKFKIPCISYPEALGQLSKHHYTIAVTGTHGKSTTTGMLAKIMIDAKLDPTIVIGTKLRELNKQNYRCGKSAYLLIEACEYKESFRYIKPDILIITNIEAEHLDYYKNLQHYLLAYTNFAKSTKKGGKVIYTAGDKNSVEALKGIKETEGIKTDNKITLKIPGEFNKGNASLAEAAAKNLGIDEKAIRESLKKYQGSWRRLEYKGKIKNTPYLDDYAHHPTEIKATLKAIREHYKPKNLLCIYQPHQYNRTWHFLKEFGKSFKDANLVIVPNIYKVRDTKEDLAKVSPEDLVKEINKNKTKAIFGDGIKNTAEYLKKNHQKYDLIVTMGAGDVDKIYNYL